jgi:hypothetical protein
MMVYGDPALLMSLTQAEKDRIVKGLTIARGSHIYGLCRDCHRLLRLDGWVGGWHVCNDE